MHKLFLLLVACTSASGAIFGIAQRRAAKVTKSVIPEGVEVLSRRQVFSEGLDVSMRSWSGTDSVDGELAFDWMLGPKLKNKDDPERIRLFRWITRFFYTLGSVYPGTVYLGVRDENGKLASMLQIFHYTKGLPKGLDDMSLFLGSMLKTAPFHGFGMFSAKDGVSNRWEKSYEFVEANHKSAMPNDRPHVYIGPLATDPSQQGKGYAGKLMRTACAAADKLGMACYLECSGTRNPAMYQRYGFVFNGKNTVLSADETQPKKFTKFYSMYREPKPSSK